MLNMIKYVLVIDGKFYKGLVGGEVYFTENPRAAMQFTNTMFALHEHDKIAPFGYDTDRASIEIKTIIGFFND